MLRAPIVALQHGFPVIGVFAEGKTKAILFPTLLHCVLTHSCISRL